VERNLETKVIKLQFASADDVAAQLKPQIEGKGVGTVIADKRSNQIVLSAYPDRLENAAKLVMSLDKPTKAVLIETRILQLTLNPTFDFGIDWGKKFPIKNVNNFKISSIFPNSNLADSNTGQMTVGDPGDNFELTVQAMKEVVSTKLLANPRVMILDRQEAKINVGDRTPYILSTTTAGGTTGVSGISNDVRFIDTGLMLTVAPIINDDGFVTMKIKPEISTKSGDVFAPTSTTDPKIGNNIPIVNSTSVESTVIVRDGVSAILGGLIRDEMTEDNMGIPYLMDIPLIGNAFKSRHEAIKKTEIVIIITPHIVTGEGNVLDKPLPIKGQSASNALGTSFSDTSLDMFSPRSFSKEAESLPVEGVEKSLAKEPAKSSFMNGVTNFFQKVSPIKKGK